MIRPLVVVPLAVLALHLSTLIGYGWFRDEFYYVACARHLAWGYVDHPPLSMAVLVPILALFGPSLAAIRLVPAACGALTVCATGLLARELGGGRYAQTVAMIAAALLPEYLALDIFYSMNAIDLLVWPVAVLFLLRALSTSAWKPWLWLGLVLGLGLLNKISVLWLGFGIFAGLLATPWRRVLKTPGPWLAGLVALACFMPHLLWQVRHGWPTLEFIRNASADKMLVSSVPEYLLAQLGVVGPAAAALSLAGLLVLFHGRADPRGRVLGWAFVAIFLLLALNGTSRAGYLAPAYTWLLAGGAGAAERWLSRRAAWGRPALAGVLVIAGLVLMPLALPILSVDRYISYARALGVAPSTEEKHDMGDLPQFFADMQGWDRIVDAVAKAADALPPDERARAVVLTGNYGEAGAIEVLGAGRNLPSVYSGHNNYWFWGPPPADTTAVLIFSRSEERQRGRFEHVVRAAETDCGRCMPYENRLPIFACWGPKVVLARLWNDLKHFD